MREIKFRAWNEGHPYPMVLNPLHRCDANNVLDKKGMYKDWILMQYTGLHDKNGKEIYEGDVVQLKTGKLSYFYAPVVYNETEARFDLEHPEGYHGHWGMTQNIIEACEYEIIGNIYENPELLTVGLTPPQPVTHE